MGRRRKRGSLETSRGAAAVEFAILLPLLMLLVLGTIDWGHYFYVREVVVNAAREGARAGTLHHQDPKSIAEAKAAASKYLSLAMNAGNASITSGVDVISAGAPGEGPTKSVWVQVDYTAKSITGILQPPLIAEKVVIRAEMRK